MEDVDEIDSVMEMVEDAGEIDTVVMRSFKGKQVGLLTYVHCSTYC